MIFIKKKYMNFGAAILMYAASVLSLLYLDIYISINLDKYFIAEWAFYKSFFLIIVSTVSLGYDSIILRNGDIYKHIKSYIFYLIIYSLVFGFFILSYKDSYDFYLVSIFCFFMGLSILLSAYFRRENKIILSQLSINGWKLLFPLFFLLIFSFDINISFVFSVLICFLLSLIFFYFCQKQKDINELNFNEKKDIKLPLIFLFINLLTLAIATNGEQVILNNFYALDFSYQIFIYTLVFCSILSGLSGFLGFYLVGYFNKIKMNLDIYKKNKKYIYYLFSLVFFINYFAGCILMNIFYNKIDYFLALIFSLIGSIRFLYVISSVLMTLYASFTALKSIAIINLIFTFLYVITFIAFSSNELTYNIYIISFLILVHWLLRVIVMNFLTIRSWIQ